MFHPMQIATTHHSSEFQIQLQDNHIILHGSSEESAGVMLRGSIIFHCHESTRVKSITLKFLGTTNVNWTEATGNHTKHHKAERKILEKEWTFLRPEKKVHHLSQGQYKWDFELPLPGNLPESVHHEMGQVSYRLKAICDRPTFSMNYTDKRDIIITRVLLPSALELSQSVLISNTWTNKVTYDISIPTKVYTCNKAIPISFDLLPLAPHLTVRSVACSLKEYTTVTTMDGQTTKSEIVNILRDDHFYPDERSGRFKKVELLQVPSSALEYYNNGSSYHSHHHHRSQHHLQEGINFDMCGELIQIKHKLKFTVSLQNADGHISELRAAIPVVIAPALPEDDENILPAYEDAWRSLPYDAQVFAQLIAMGEIPSNCPSSSFSSPSSTPVSSSTRSRSTTTNSSSSDSLASLSNSSLLSSARSSLYLEPEDEELFNTEQPTPAAVCWRGMDICRVPSYATALRTTDVPCTLTPSLPTYESISIA